ncbi:hypothetical protein [Catenulispora pinisilvae]|uniref:hypothetical protein n=1 Tax=Catenulispora pinisilvae TaxID=2705253 RepID=UPI0018924212|nr:hypothetical protein [Catenulispora pinisilvae]
MSFDEPGDDYLDDLSRTRDEGSRYPASAPPGPADDDYDFDTGGVSRSGSENEPTTPLPTRSRPVLPPDPPSRWRQRGGRVWRFTRTLAFTVLVLAGLAAIGDVLINHYPRTSRHTYAYSNVQQLLVAVDGNGSIDITGTDSEQVTIKAVDKGTLLEPVERQIISSGGWLIVSVHCPNNECSSKYDIQVPRSMSVDAIMDHSSDQADISATGLSAAVRLFTGRGNVTMNHLATTSDVSVTANGQVEATDVSAANLEVFAPIGDKIDLGVAGDIANIQNIRVTAGQPAEVTLTVPAGGYRISCVPSGHCTGASGDITQDQTGPVHEDPNSTHNIQVNVVQNTAKIQAAG